MIVKILSRGKSFKGLATYLTHDPEAKTAERVSWTRTLNLAQDDVPGAVDSMVWTARNAELLKQEAGIRAGGRATENAVKHLSLNWAPDEHPTREHMVETAENFLRAMKWQEHQALLVAHEDKHPHVHVMLNVVHPETGLRLDDNFERRRAQAWALGYEREQGRIYCEQRLKNADEREDAPTRPAWLAFQKKEKEFEGDEKSLRDHDADLSENHKNPKIAHFAEWKILKEIQRHEREEFFANGKSEFSELRLSIYREVREEFRERWGDFYAARRDGADGEVLAILKAELLADQKATLEARRDEACNALRESRDGLYRELLDDQRDIRLGLRARQEAGLDNTLFFRCVEDRNADKDRAAAPTFRATADEVVAQREDNGSDAEAEAFTAWPQHENSGMRSGADIGTGLGFGLLSLISSLGDGLVGAKPDPKSRQAEPKPRAPDLFEVAANEARQRQQREREEAADEEGRRRQRSYGE